MRNRQLLLDYDDGDPDWFELREIDRDTNHQNVRVLLASDGFELHHLRDALLATGWVRDEDRHMVIQPDMATPFIKDVVGEMFAYFISPGVPSAELLEIQSAVGAFDVATKANTRIPYFAYAWLDIMVREDLAEEARNAGNVWQGGQLEVDVERCCRQRVEQFVNRYQQQTSLSPTSRMAPSARQPSRSERATKLG